MTSLHYVEAETPRANESVNKAPGENSSSSKPNAKLVSLGDLFSYADSTEKILMLLGTIGALVAGLDQPIMILLLGDVLNDFNPSDIFESIIDNIRDAALLYVYVGIAVLLAGCLQVACWSITASRQAKHIRGAYVTAILTKEIGWFDMNDPMQLPSRVTETTAKIQKGMGRKVDDGIHYFSTAVSGLAIGLVKG